MAEALAVIIIIISITLIVLVLVQSKGADLGGFLGGGGGDGVQRTRRGVDAAMHRFTIGLAVLFFVIVLIAFFVWGA
jgi:preprotein translocase subunit SecG